VSATQLNLGTEQPVKAQIPKLAAAAQDSFESPALMHKRARAVAKELKKFLRQNPNQQLEIDGQKYPKIESWQFVGACYGHTAMISQTAEVVEEKDSGFSAVAHILNATGRVVSGAEAVCMRSEPEWESSPAFQLRSMASTRACAKGFRNIFAYVMEIAGLGATPAEEMPHFQNQELWRKCYDCGHKVSDKKSLETKRKYGRTLCIDHEKAEKAKIADTVVEPIKDPKFVEQSVARVKARKAAGAQPVVDALDDEPKREVTA
jgi:hypothetical protein